MTHLVKHYIKKAIAYFIGGENTKQVENFIAPKSRDYEKEQAFDTLQKILLMGIIVLQFSQLN